MKIRKKYKKNRDGSITCSICCLTADDFPSDWIFVDGKVDLAGGVSSETTVRAATVKECETTVEALINEIAFQLGAWRGIELPPDKVVEL